jgi:RND family efflux transporter MFP subunit
MTVESFGHPGLPVAPNRRHVAGICCVSILIPALLSGCGGDPSATPIPADKLAPRRVRLVEASEARVARTVSATGTLAADDEVVLGAKVEGRLGEISVDLGSRVRKGQPLARISQNDYRLKVKQAEAAVQQARARLGLSPKGQGDRVDPKESGLVRQAAAVLKEARLTHQRMVELSKRDLVARAQLDAAISQLSVAEGRYQDAIEEVRNRQAILAQRRSELEIARQQLADTVIVSPIDGAVKQRQASVGEYLKEGDPVVTVVRVHPLRLRLAVPEREASAVRLGQEVRLSVEGDPTVYHGRVARLAPAITEANRTLLIEAEVPNERGVLRPGAFAKAEVVIAAGQQVVTVPAEAVVTFAGLNKVLMVKNGKVVERRVRKGRRLGDAVVIAEGVAGGDRVIAKPGNLVGGQAVTIVN